MQVPWTLNPLFQAFVIGISVYFGFKYIRIGLKEIIEEKRQQDIMQLLPGVYPK